MKVFDEIIESIEHESLNASSDIKRAATENMWSAYIDAESFNDCSINELLNFICNVRKALLSKWNKNFTFYLWFDAMAGQIRFSSFNGTESSLPFRCDVNESVDGLDMANQIFTSLEFLYKDAGSESDGPLQVYVYRCNEEKLKSI